MRDEVKEPTPLAFYAARHPLADPVCTGCGEVPNLTHIGPREVLFCRGCRAFCQVGENLLSTWKDETEEQWEQREAELADFRPVPFYGPESTDAPPGIRAIVNAAAWRARHDDDARRHSN